VNRGLDRPGSDCRVPDREEARRGIVLDVILGIVGGVVGGFIFRFFGASGVKGAQHLEPDRRRDRGGVVYHAVR